MTRTLRRRARRLVVVALLSVPLPGSGCGDREMAGAVGPNDELSFFTNQTRDGSVEREVERLFEYPVDVVTSERAFRVDTVPWGDFRVHRQVKNQVFAVDLSSDDRVAGHVREQLARHAPEQLEARRPFRLLVQDTYAQGQTTLYFAGWSTSDLVELLAGPDSTAVRREYEASVIRGLTRTLFALGEETDYPRQMDRDFGWTLRLPTGFNAAGDPDGDFVKFNAELPVRLVLVHWVDEEVPLTPEAWAPIMERMLRVYNDGDYVHEERSLVHPAEFHGVEALRWEGVWQNDKYVIGGPFRALAFRSPTRSWLLMGMVYNPGGEKLSPLRQTEAILHTFRETR